ncbi:MAG: hypothetical protein IT370_28300 [Deltaproteobacteria bacterium]|nr:hypothetical protein [Deltaproteobacteria bacterium]
MTVRMTVLVLAAVLVSGCLEKKKKASTNPGASTSTSPTGGTVEWPVGTWRGQGTYAVVATGDRSSLPVRLDINTADAGGFVLSFSPYSATLAPDPTRPNVLMGDARYEALDDAIGKATFIVTQPGKAQLLLQYPVSKGFGAFSLEAELSFAP